MSPAKPFFGVDTSALQSFNMAVLFESDLVAIKEVSQQQAAQWAEGLLEKMTLKEKCQYIGGDQVFYTQKIERLGLAQVLFADATAGVVLRDRFFEATYQNPLKKSTAFPAPIMLAATWNTSLAQDYATSIGEQCAGNGIGVLLGPGFNLYRISQCGRNFEYFGEDPYLISRLVEHYVKGVQSTGTAATLKHFVANNTDYFRRKSNSVVDARTLHEIYLPGFKAGIDAGALAVMTGYNLVNGEWAGQSHEIITQLLRKTLGFKGLVMTDWWSVYDGTKMVLSGQDLEMPAQDAGASILAAIEAGTIPEQAVDRMVKSILTTLKRLDLFARQATPIDAPTYRQHEAIALQTAREGIVLLRNQNNALPLAKNTPILALGEGHMETMSGGGSSFVKGYDHVLPFTALKTAFENIQYCASPTDADIQAAHCIILSLGTKDAESYDRPFELNRSEQRYINRIVGLNQNVVLLVNAGGGIRMTDWHHKTAAIVYCWYSGQNGSTAVAEVLLGTTNPSGKLPITIEREFSHGPGAHYIPEGEVLYCGENDALEKARKVYDVTYSEGVFVGYRWYEHKNIAPLYPFGFGLSYTQFEYANLSLSATEKPSSAALTLTFTLKNTGPVAGKEVAQIYIKNAKASVPRPIKELKGFIKTALAAGQETSLTHTLQPNDFAYWSPEKQDWWVEPGDFEIWVAASSEDIRLKHSIRVS